MMASSNHTWEHPLHSWERPHDGNGSLDAEGWGYDSSDWEEPHSLIGEEFVQLMLSHLHERTLNAKQFCQLMYWAGRAGVQDAIKYGLAPYPISTPTQSSGSGSGTLQLGGGICVASSANAFPANVDVVDGAPCSQCCSFSDGYLMHSLQVSGRMDATTTWNGDPKTETAKRRWVDRFHFEHVWFTSRAIGPSTQPH